MTQSNDECKVIPKVDPSAWMANGRIAMVLCDKRDAIVVTATGFCLKCENKEDDVKVLAAMEYGKYTSMGCSQNDTH